MKQRPRPDYTEELRDRDLKIVEPRKSNPELIEHDRRRAVEVECVQLQDELEERGFVAGSSAHRVWRVRRSPV